MVDALGALRSRARSWSGLGFALGIGIGLGLRLGIGIGLGLSLGSGIGLGLCLGSGIGLKLRLGSGLGQAQRSTGRARARGLDRRVWPEGHVGLSLAIEAVNPQRAVAQHDGVGGVAAPL